MDDEAALNVVIEWLMGQDIVRSPKHIARAAELIADWPGREDGYVQGILDALGAFG